MIRSTISPLPIIMQISLLFALFSLSSFALSDVSKTIYTGLTYTDNLELQLATDIGTNNQEALIRRGFVTGFSLLKQELDYTGGYTLQADTSFNKGFSNNSDITTFLLSASKLSALNENWLLRHNISINRYDNEALASNSYDGVTLQTTLGFLDKAGGGNDISFSLKQERHDQDEQDTYDITRSGIKFTHYFSHKKNAPAWNMDAGLKNNNATTNNRDYHSIGLGTTYKQWNLASFKGQLRLSWQQDRYDQSVRLSPRGMIIQTNRMPNGGTAMGINNSMMNMNSSEKKRNDNLYSLSLQLSKALTPAIALQLSTNLGIYDSTISNNSDDFYNLATTLTWNF